MWHRRTKLFLCLNSAIIVLICLPLVSVLKVDLITSIPLLFFILLVGNLICITLLILINGSPMSIYDHFNMAVDGDDYTVLVTSHGWSFKEILIWRGQYEVDLLFWDMNTSPYLRSTRLKGDRFNNSRSYYEGEVIQILKNKA